MNTKGLHSYNKYIRLTGEQLIFPTSKGKILIVPGMLFGICFDKKISLILNNDINKIFYITYKTYTYLIDNSESEIVYNYKHK